MLRNVEIKAKVRDLGDTVSKAKKLSNSEGTWIKQDDIFFRIPQGRGRLKLRTFEDRSAELIFYDRPDSDGPKLSKYDKCSVPNGSQMSSVLSFALGVEGSVKKKRQLFMVGQTRVHIDYVEKLGNFMELEVVLSEDQTLDEGKLIAQSLMADLGVRKEDLVSGTYMDLLLK
ncbi:uncharacterized protein LOC110834301 [Zootermopsis nevadensis]|uniref:CYTH domain-containing protein n=1 Tax=Zootermopsis nevadensis TaxID=136037 RepID=A0A067QYW2_ZOONE|nr:uncharacterized protein LOC110834301 [Zootermopsis nevadensis]XP_021928994.1 uncharacterized protein LOC110834301 [Zootermopsis nevadensis]XP_021928996.1 uncharacterized protein LOC110834301 [Zootermopsis nevadensis]XP_021928997.1 uncharacterized protein LOC110834301 [Zootermopsis nevadensis]KDR14706.1 hypothetical protein L798_11479 [Zootermopsis nevadensis]